MADGSVIIDTELDQSGLKEGLSSLGTSLTKGIATAVAAAGAALAGLGKYAINVGSDFEYAISGVAATMGKTKEEITEISDKAKELGASTKFTATEAAEGFNILAQAGLDADEQLQAIGATLALASAGEMSMESSAGYLTTTVKAMSTSFREAGISMDDCTRIADMYAKGATLANTSTAQLGEAVSVAASVGGSYNQSLSTMTTSLLALAEKGYQGSAAGNYLARAMSDLYAPTANAKNALDELGVSIYENGKQRDFIDIINDMNEKLADYTEEEKAAYTGTIFTTAGLKAFNSIAGNSAEQLAELQGKLENCEGAAQKMADTKLDNLQGDITILKSATEGFGIALYDVMNGIGAEGDKSAGMLRDFVKEAQEIMGDLTEAVKTGGFDGLAEGIGAALSKAINKIVEYVPMFAKISVNLVQSFAQGLAASAPQITNAVTQLIPILTSGFLNIISDLVELGGELILAICDGLASNADQMVDAVTVGFIGLANKVVEYLPQLIAAGVQLVCALAEGIVSAVPQLVETLPTIFDELLNGIMEAFPIILDAIISLVDSLVQEIPVIAQKIAEAIPQIVQKVVDTITTTLPQLISAITSVVRSIISSLPNIINTISMSLPSLINGVIAALLDLLPLFVDCGVQLFVSLVQAMPDIIYAIVNVLPVLVSSIVAAIIEMVPLLIECGIELFVSLVKALPEIIIAIVAVIPQIINSVIQAIIDSLPLIIQCGIDLFVALIEALPDIIVAICTAIPEIISSIINAIIDNLPLIIDSGIKLFVSLIENLPQIISQLKTAVPKIIDALVNAFKSSFSQIKDVGSNLLKGLWNGIKSAKDWVVSKVKSVCHDIFQHIKDFFHISSPSKLFENVIGKNLMLGLAEGVEDEADTAIGAVMNAADDIANVQFKPSVDYDNLFSQMHNNVMQMQYESGELAVSSRSAGSSYELYDSDNDNSGDDAPKYIENNIYVDGKKTARVITPYVAKELQWEEK